MAVNPPPAIAVTTAVWSQVGSPRRQPGDPAETLDGGVDGTAATLNVQPAELIHALTAAANREATERDTSKKGQLTEFLTNDRMELAIGAGILGFFALLVRAILIARGVI